MQSTLFLLYNYNFFNILIYINFYWLNSYDKNNILKIYI